MESNHPKSSESRHRRLAGALEPLRRGRERRYEGRAPRTAARSSAAAGAGRSARSRRSQSAATAREWRAVAKGATTSQRFCCGSYASAEATAPDPSTPPAT